MNAGVLDLRWLFRPGSEVGPCGLHTHPPHTGGGFTSCSPPPPTFQLRFPRARLVSAICGPDGLLSLQNLFFCLFLASCCPASARVTVMSSASQSHLLGKLGNISTRRGCLVDLFYRILFFFVRIRTGASCVGAESRLTVFPPPRGASAASVVPVVSTGPGFRPPRPVDRCLRFTGEEALRYN